MSIQLEERLFIGDKKFASGYVAGAKEVDAAVDAAEKAWPAWANGDPTIRAKVLHKLGDLIDENAKNLGVVQSIPNGQTCGAVDDWYQGLHRDSHIYSNCRDKIHGKTSLDVPGFLGMQIRQPYGCIDLFLTFQKLPLSALLFADLAEDAGYVHLYPFKIDNLAPLQCSLPDEILSILSAARETGELLASHFTGSTVTRRVVSQAAAQSNLKTVALELCGQSLVIVFDDCDAEDAATRMLVKMYAAATRVYIQNFRFFAGKLVVAAEKLKFGDPNDREHKCILKYIDIGNEEGQSVLTTDVPSWIGTYVFVTQIYRATILSLRSSPTPKTTQPFGINQEEIFGPVAVLHRFSTEGKGVIYTNDTSQAIRFDKGLESRTVGVNTLVMTHPNLAYGGWKGSGIWRELVDHTIEAYMGFVEGSGERIDVINPATKEKIASVHVAGQKEVDAAVEAAEKAWPAWADGDPSTRARAMHKLADLVDENADALGLAQSLEMGKPIKDSVYAYALSTHEYKEIHGKTSLNVPGFLGLEIRQPYGVTAGIIPWNGPLAMLAWKTAPALATGNASIIKTSEKSPLSALLFAGLVAKAGIPDGVLSILSGARETGQLLASHMRIRKIAFTGSALVGKSVAEAAARSNLKSCTLELGGKSPVVVFEDCDMEDAVTRVLGGFNRNSGQICVAGTRLYVQDTIFDKFSQKLAASAESYKVGEPTDQSFSSGPQVDILQHKRILQYIETGKAEGAKVLTGGAAGDDKGFYVKPTIFVDVKDDATINKEEIFGPVAVLHKFSTEEEVLKRANDTEYGLAAYVFTKDVSRAIRFAKGLEAGQVGVNTTGNAHPDLAFGGWKGSGIGRELGDHSIDAYTEVKTIFIR
ncbi:hypothetical protein CVT25_009543 [Psilocybe cyanescens]|uniref:Aldehyde dehydrogenase domain-containing protein n=1 Tax=Psilocybe cyanescens TaxID=93625 RepID=A0A409XVC6_PSICY|nr:hypothetical protein CVT25_009543 [Psilocybe cyanescens]